MLIILSSIATAYLYQKLSIFKHKNILIGLIVICLFLFDMKQTAIIFALGALWYQTNKLISLFLTSAIIASILYLSIMSPNETVLILIGIVVFIVVNNDLNSSDYAIRKIGGMALTDPLTETYNRNFYNNVMEDLLRNTQLTKNPVSYMMLDIDHFKAYNDTHGHDQGDVILKEFARVFLKNIRSTDYVVRLGGEEFCIVLPETTLKWAETIAYRIKKEIAAFNLTSQKEDNTTVCNTISIGISSYPYPADTKNLLEKQADLALYKAKEKRNSVVLFQ